MPNQSIGYVTGSGPGPTGPCGQAIWTVRFLVTSQNGVAIVPDASAAGGWIVQKIIATYDVVDCKTGQPLNPNPNPYVYYEAWQVGADGSVPATAASWDNWDAWNFVRREGTRGSIKTVGEASFHRQFQAGEMPAGGVPNAGALRSSVTRPAGLASPTLTREMTVIWNCCNGSAPTDVNAKAQNSWGTYSESWKWQYPRPTAEHEKIVDGNKVE